jgi:hypothetical protein
MIKMRRAKRVDLFCEAPIADDPRPDRRLHQEPRLISSGARQVSGRNDEDAVAPTLSKAGPAHSFETAYVGRDKTTIDPRLEADVMVGRVEAVCLRSDPRHSFVRWPGARNFRLEGDDRASWRVRKNGEIIRPIESAVPKFTDFSFDDGEKPIAEFIVQSGVDKLA